MQDRDQLPATLEETEAVSRVNGFKLTYANLTKFEIVMDSESDEVQYSKDKHI